MKLRNRYYVNLKGKLFVNGLGYTEVAKWLNRCVAYVSNCMNGLSVFTIEEVYTICDKLNISYDSIPRFFPVGGGK